MHKRDAQQRIILALGREGEPLYPHAIAERTGLSDAGVQSAIKGTHGLVSAGMLKPFHEESWKAGGKKVDYILMFRGAVEYLNLIGGRVGTSIMANDELKIVDRHDADEEIKKFIHKYSKFDEFRDYAPFKEHGALKEWLGDGTYWFFSATARNIQSDNLPYAVTATRLKFLEMEMSVLSDELDKAESPQRDEIGRRIRAARGDTEKLWMHAFSLMLFEMIAFHTKTIKRIKRVPNAALHKHIKETFEKERKECGGRLKDIREMKATFEKVFSPNLKLGRK